MECARAESRVFMAVLKDMVRRNHPFVIALVETHMGGDQATKISQSLGYYGHTRVDAIGFRGGIWVYWQPGLVTVEPITKHEQFIMMNITQVGTIPWYITAIYMIPDPSKRQDLWRELKDFANTIAIYGSWPAIQ